MEPYKYKRKLVKVGNSRVVSIPAEWLKKQAQRLGKKIIETIDLLIYENYIEIRPAEE